MPGIVVGVDGSGHSRKALETAVAEAAAHGMPLTVLVIHQAVRDVYGSASHYGDDAALTEKAKEAAQAETDQVLAAAGSQPASVTVTAVHPVALTVNVAAPVPELFAVMYTGCGRFRIPATGILQ